MKLFGTWSLVLLLAGAVQAQVMEKDVRTNKKDGGYQFTVVSELGATSVKNQFKSGTCWSYSSMSFLETDLLESGKGMHDLSEMFIVRQAYMQKARNYVRMMGKTNLGPGGEFHDVMNVVRQYGLVPQEVYAGKQTKPEHNEMDEVVKAMLDAIIKLPNGKLSPDWDDAVAGVLDAYLGKVPETFEYNGKTYTPKSYAESLGVNADDYIAFTSFTHHAFDKQIVVEVPDNWAGGLAYNVPMAELESIADYALSHDHAIAWASDVSEKGFSFKNGLAIVPAKPWEEMTPEERTTMFDKPGAEMKITQQMRQEGFDNLSTQDDHGMHLTGIVKDQTGAKYYIVKNSWGTEGNDCGGFFYVSAPYYLYKTTFIMVHKDGVPANIAKRLGIK